MAAKAQPPREQRLENSDEQGRRRLAVGAREHRAAA